MRKYWDIILTLPAVAVKAELLPLSPGEIKSVSAGELIEEMVMKMVFMLLKK